MATKKAAPKKVAFGKSNEEILAALGENSTDDIDSGAEFGSDGGEDGTKIPRHKIQNGSNLFLLIPPTKSRYPFRSVGVHYKPYLNICRRDGARLEKGKDGKLEPVRDIRFHNCFLCQSAFDNYGRNGQDLEVWRKTEDYPKFKDWMSKDSMLFMAIPVNMLYETSVEIDPDTEITTYDVKPKENMQEIFLRLQSEYIEYTKEEEFMELCNTRKTLPGMEFTEDGVDYISGPQAILFSFDVWRKVVRPEMMKMIKAKSGAAIPWGLSEDGDFQYVMDIRRSGSVKDLNSIKYECEFIKVEPDTLFFTPEFVEAIQAETFIGTDVEDVMPRPTIEEQKEMVKNMTSGPNEEDAPSCYTDPEVYGPFREECIECNFRRKCVEKIKKGVRYKSSSSNSNTDQDDSKPKEGTTKLKPKNVESEDSSEDNSDALERSDFDEADFATDFDDDNDFDESDLSL